MIRHLVAGACCCLLASACSSDNNPNPDAGPPLPFIVDPLRADAGCDWMQWGQNWAHTGATCAPAQSLDRSLDQVVFDPFVDLEIAEAEGLFQREGLFAHYAAPLVQGDDAYIAVKAGSYEPCTPPGSRTPDGCGFDGWANQVWTVQHHVWNGGVLELQGTFESDWKPPAWQVVSAWEPVFQHAITQNAVYVPGAGGTLWKLDRSLGSPQQIDPLAPFNANRYVTGPVVVDADGTVFYNVIELAPLNPLSNDAVGYLVKVSPTGQTSFRQYSDLVSGGPSAASQCPYSFAAGNISPPWPATVPVPTGPCGSQRPGWNSAPAIGPGGVLFVVSRAHFTGQDSWLTALNTDLSTRWSFHLSQILNDGCGVLMPSNAVSATDPTCRVGAPVGVDRNTGLKPTAIVSDQASSVPVALPDGAVIYGSFTAYNTARGHLIKVSPTGTLMAMFDFGWDVSPAVWIRNNTYSIITKDNHYFSWTSDNEGPFNISQLDRNLKVEWSYTSSQTQSCVTLPDGGVSCVTDHPSGFEWCINAPAVAPDGTVYGNSEDGRVYAIRQGGTLYQDRFLLQSLEAAYTPITVDSQGRVYSLNGGVMTVVGH